MTKVRFNTWFKGYRPGEVAKLRGKALDCALYAFDAACPAAQEKVPDEFTPGVLSGTLPITGVGYDITSPVGTTITANPLNDFTVGDSGSVSDVVFTFSEPVCIKMAPVDVGGGAIWHDTPAQGVTTVTTDGSPWVYTPGADHTLPLVGIGTQVVDASNVTGPNIQSAEDWGCLESVGVTRYQFQSWVFDSFKLQVLAPVGK